MKNVNHTIGQINVNSILSKFNLLKELVLKHVDILVVCETKLDETFPGSQFHMAGFSLPYRLDRNRNGGGVMIFVKEDIPRKLLLTKHNFPSDVEDLFVELIFTKPKWLWHQPAQNDQYFFNCIDKALDSYSTYVLLAGDFNAEDGEPCLSNFLYQHDLYIVVNDITLLMISGKMTEYTAKN